MGISQLIHWRAKAKCKICLNFKWDKVPECQSECDHSIRFPLSSLLKSAKEDCRTCRILEEVVRSFHSVGSPTETTLEFTVPGYLEGTQTNEHGDFGWSGCFGSNIGRHGDRTYYAELEVYDPNESDPDGSRLCLELYNSPASRYQWPRLVEKVDLPQDTASETSFSWAAAQLHHCLGQHEKCRAKPDETPALPTRVLDLGSCLVGVEPVIVLETAGLRGRYVALSHCWGDPNLMTTKLTAHTKEKYKETGITLDSLPRTFRDAVTFTRKLGIRYLWIDSLCIIQSDREKDSDGDKELAFQDWARESGRMCDVYRNSHLTLAALSSTSCNGGFFFRPKTIEINGRTSLYRRFRIFARQELAHNAARFPLMHRGWVAQEFLLSPRTLLFGEGELLWRCIEHTTCQCTKGEYAGFGRFENYSKLPRIDVKSQTSSGYGFDPANRWRDIIRAYSWTSLSEQTDKLAAVDGIAQYMRPLRKCDYLAGLWSDCLAFDLVWQSIVPDSGPRIRSSQPRATESRFDQSHLFPTWSWASTTESVDWHYDYHPDGWGPAKADNVTYLGHQFSPSNPERPQLILRGVLIASLPEDEVAGSEYSGRKITGKYYPDQERNQQLVVANEPEVYYCLRVLLFDRACYSLVLRCKDKENGVYERLGLLVYEILHGSLDEVAYSELFVKGEYENPRNLQVEGLTPWWQFCTNQAPNPITFTLV